MAGPAASDRSLLDRLNALKPTSVTLDASKNVLDQPSEPASREDALSARLRTLRNQSQGEGSPKSTPPRAESPYGTAASPSKSEAAQTSRSPFQPAPSLPPIGGQDEDDPLQFADEQALHDFLEDLGGDDQQWSIDPGDPGDESQRVAALLESLGKNLKPPENQEGNLGDEKDDDDSEGEEMSREVEKVMSQAHDELELDRNTSQAQHQDQSDTDQEKAKGQASPESPKDEEADDKGDRETKVPNEEKSQENTDQDGADLGLPVVPSVLTDPAPERPPLDFEDDISARMAALRGLSTDAFGLPSAPTFHPEDRPASASASALAKKNAGKAGYTDEDQKTWCVVCLEDATIRCVDCDDDVYCARCWREMHVGPAAGFDERGHKWVKFSR